MGDQVYDQPDKNFVREKVISQSVRALTFERQASPVVTISEFDAALEYSLKILSQTNSPISLRDVSSHSGSWRDLHCSRVGSRNPADLHVLFLAGPDPTNDIMAFRAAGIPFENIWAIERDSAAFAKAVSASGKHGIRVKLHRGSLHEFFAVVPQQFDIIYFDATGPLFGGSPNTLDVIKELLLNQRLAPLAVLITNFADPLGDKSQSEEWFRRIGVWAYANGDNDVLALGFDQFLANQLKPNFVGYYGEFITKFMIRFAAQMVPWWRIAALPGAKREFYNSEESLKTAAEKTSLPNLMAHHFYPLLRLSLFSEWYLKDSSDPLRDLLSGSRSNLKKAKLGDAIKIASLVRTFFEYNFDGVNDSTNHVLEACSPDLAKALETFEWFDQRERIFCDVPLPNLTTDLLLGLYGFPYHVNAGKIDRFAYKAKETIMFTDLLVFDQARYEVASI